jgi:hypothetical protein
MKLTDDVSPRLMYLKAGLFLFTGVFAVVGLLLDHPDPRTAALLAIAIWSFCRLYYFAFYVIEKYIDPEYRFAGLYSFLVYLLKNRHSK